jgi:hypothetical protein
VSAPEHQNARVADYLERLRDVLPPRQASSIVAEVAALIEDRVEQAGDPTDRASAVDRALKALGSPETLATSLSGGQAAAQVATRNAFGRLLPLVFGVHLLLAIVLTVVGAGTAFVPGLIGALPTTSALSTAFGVIGVFFVDVGVVVVVLALLGRDRVPALLHRVRLDMPGTRRDAILSLVLLALVAVIVDVPEFRDALFALGSDDSRSPLLSPEVLALWPAWNAVILLFAVRHALLAISGAERVLGLVLDALASLAAAAFAVLLMTRDEIVRIPANAGLSEEQARTFADLILRVAFVVCLSCALLLVARAIRRLLRIRQILAG